MYSFFFQNNDVLRSSVRCDSNRKNTRPDQPFPCSTSSVESLPSASGSSSYIFLLLKVDFILRKKIDLQ